MPHQATVTAKTGPDRLVTGMVIPNVLGIDFQLADKRLFIQVENQAGDTIREFELTSVTTVTFTINPTTKEYAVVVS